MLRQRVLVTVVALPLGIAVIVVGGWLLVALVALILALAVGEYADLFKAAGSQPAKALMIGGVVVLVLLRYIPSFVSDAWMPIAILLFLALFVHLIAYERGRDKAASDFAVTVSGLFYIAVLGSYFVSLRELPEGQWYLILTLVSVWVADSAAYFIGSAWGKHKMTPRLSPKKSWEGYIAGVVFGTAFAPLFLLLFRRLGMSTVALSLTEASLLGFAVSLLPTLGDLGESMIKRQVGVKDSSGLLPGHGGIFDRIDSWLWALPIGFFLIAFIFLQR